METHLSHTVFFVSLLILTRASCCSAEVCRCRGHGGSSGVSPLATAFFVFKEIIKIFESCYYFHNAY